MTKPPWLTRGIDIRVSPVSNAPKYIRNAFEQPLPEGGDFVILSARVARDIALEASILLQARAQLLARVTLPDGQVVLLFAPGLGTFE